MKARRFFAFVAGAAMLFGVGCTPEGGADEDTTTPAEIAVSPAETAISLEGDTKTFSVTSNASWVATCDVEGVTVSPELGKGNASVTVVVPATTAARSVVVTFNASKPASMDGFSYNSTATATATIFQNAGGEVVEDGIASIKTAGDYDIEGAWVVAASSQSFVMTDNSGGCILTYLGNGATIPAVGTVLNVSGAVTTYGGLLQFGKDATITPTGETVNVAYGTPMDISTYSALDAYAKNLSVVYAEMKGQLVVKDSGKGYNNYNLVIEGHDDHNDYKGSISYAPTALANQLNDLNGAYIVARGYMVGISGTVYANMVTLSVEVDSSHPVLQAENIAGVPAAGVTNATHEITVAAIEKVNAACDGTVVTFAEVNGNVLTYSVSANEGAAREGEITLSAEGVESVTIKVAQKAAASGEVGEEKTATIVFNTLGLANAEVVDGRTFEVDENVSLVFSKGTASTAPAYYNASNGIRMYQNGAVLDVTANGKTITSIDFEFDYNMWYLGCDTGSLTAESNTRTWSGEATDIKFTCIGTSSSTRAYIKSMTITYR